MIPFIRYLCLSLPLLAATPLAADITLYAGLGENVAEETLVRNDQPFVLGGYAQQAGSTLLLGFDLAGEGEMLDSTYGGNEIRQAISFNFLVGTAVSQTPYSSIDLGLLLGLRETFADCPDSFIGYQCYANDVPETDYDFQYGGLLSMSFNSFTFGVRATEVSTSVIAGVRF